MPDRAEIVSTSIALGSTIPLAVPYFWQSPWWLGIGAFLAMLTIIGNFVLMLRRLHKARKEDELNK